MSDGTIRLPQRLTDPDNPETGEWSIYTKSDGLHIKNSSGSVTNIIGNSDGWTPASESWTYETSDSPTFTFTTSASYINQVYSPGMKFKMTHDSSTKYAICTAVGGSTVTIYMGTDYVLSASSITNPYYSVQKSPFGFPLDPTKWRVSFIDDVTRTQNNPTYSPATWYNINSTSIIIPTGNWILQPNFQIYSTKAANGGLSYEVALSTSTDSVSDNDLWSYVSETNSGYNLVTIVYRQYKYFKYLTLSSKTQYYLIIKTGTGLSSLNYQYVHLYAVSSYL